MNYFRCTVGGSGGKWKLTVTCTSVFAGLTITCTDGTTTLTKTCPSSSPYTVVFNITNGGTWTISGVYGGKTNTTTVVIPDTATLDYIPTGSTATPTNDIQTWLHCANIWNKSYTTINQVLADTSTLLALISSNNAADYMARSTNWASSVCANSIAMGYIGNNDYCANKLLANSTWLNAICNSTYFESVLNVKVPTMTSDNQPYGKVIYSSQGNSAYHAFDGNDSTSWQPATGNDGFIGYEFVNACRVLRMDYTPTPSDVNRPLLGIFEGSVDNVSYTTIQNFNNQKPTQFTKFTFPSNANNYKFYRLNVKRSTAYDTVIPTLQFYGRA